jgi:hypothetical protein
MAGLAFIIDENDAILPAGSSMLALMTCKTRGMAAARMVNGIGPMQKLAEYVTDPIHDCFSPLDGTGLFPVTAALNHSCEVRDDVIMTARPGELVLAG